MNFYHFIPVPSLQSFMQGKPLVIPTLCPTPNLVSHGVLTLYGQYQGPMVWNLTQQDPLEGKVGNPADFEYLKLGFEEKEGGDNHFTLTLLTPKEREQFIKNEILPKGPSSVFMMPKAWERKQNRTLTGGTLMVAFDSLATVFQTILMQVVDARRPNNAQLYPDAKSKLEPTRNIHTYAASYLKGYGRSLERVLKERPQALNLMGANALAEVKREQALFQTLKAVTDHLGELVTYYQKYVPPKIPSIQELIHERLEFHPIGYALRSGQPVPENAGSFLIELEQEAIALQQKKLNEASRPAHATALEEAIVRDVAALSKDAFTTSYL